MKWFKRRREVDTERQPTSADHSVGRPGRLDNETRTTSASEALHAFLKRAESLAVLDESLFRTDVDCLRRTWRGPDIATGEILEIFSALAENVGRDTSVRGCREFIVTSTVDNSRAQLDSRQLARGESYSYRVWRTDDAYHLFYSAPDAVMPTEIHITLDSPKYHARASAEYAQELSRKTREGALDALAARYGADWARAVKAHISLEGPEVTYVISGVKLEGTNFRARKRELQSEFDRHWLRAIETTET